MKIFLIEIYCNFDTLSNTYMPLSLTFFVSKANSFQLTLHRELYMDARRYGIIFKLNTKREIPYLPATMYYFVYHIDTIALHWQEKQTSLANENKWIDNPRITIVQSAGTKSQDEKIRWIMIIKTTMGVIFNLKFSFIDFVHSNKISEWLIA